MVRFPTIRSKQRDGVGAIEAIAGCRGGIRSKESKTAVEGEAKDSDRRRVAQAGSGVENKKIKFLPGNGAPVVVSPL